MEPHLSKGKEMLPWEGGIAFGTSVWLLYTLVWNGPNNPVIDPLQ